MGNEGFCQTDTRDVRSSAVINIVDDIPVVRGSFNFKNHQTFKKIQAAAMSFCEERKLDNHYFSLVARIIAYRHDNLFEAYKRLPQQQREQFMDDLFYVDIQLMDSVQIYQCKLYHNFIVQKRQSMIKTQAPSRVVYIDSEVYPFQKYQNSLQKGNQLLFSNRVGLVLMCGGASSRFFSQDKFLCPLDISGNKCILQLLFERAAQNIRNSNNNRLTIPILICCNQNNRNQIEKFLHKYNYFGFDVKKVRFVQIFNLPILNQQGKFCLSFEYKVLSRPSGTGKCVEEVLGQNLSGFLSNEGVDYLHFCGAQNAAENPLDPFFIGITVTEKRQISGKCVAPAFESENFHRYVAQHKKISLMDMDTLSNFSKLKLLVESPIAMNSFVCDIKAMKQAVKDFNNNMFLSKQYRVYECTADYFDFMKEKPEIKKTCYMFQKDIGDILTVCNKPLLVKVPRSQFIPVITKFDEYSLKSASKKISQIIVKNKANTNSIVSSTSIINT